MKKLFIKSICLIIGVSSILGVMSIMFIRTNQYQNYMGKAKYFKRDVPYNLEIVNLGNSYSEYAMHYNNVDLNGYNMAFTAQTLYYDLQILEQYHERLGKDCVVLINVCYISFGEDIVKNVFKRYYWLLEKERIKDYSLTGLIMAKYIPVLFDLGAVSALVDDELPHEDLMLQGNRVSRENLIITGKQAALNKQKQYLSQHQAYAEQIKILQQMIRFCIDHGYRPVLFTPPFTKYINDNIPQESLEQYFYEPIQDLNIYNIPYLDYSHDKRFAGNPDLFLDLTHLNAAGREKFSEIIFKDLQELGL